MNTSEDDTRTTSDTVEEQNDNKTLSNNSPTTSSETTSNNSSTTSSKSRSIRTTSTDVFRQQTSPQNPSLQPLIARNGLFSTKLSSKENTLRKTSEKYPFLCRASFVEVKIPQKTAKPGNVIKQLHGKERRGK